VRGKVILPEGKMLAIYTLKVAIMIYIHVFFIVGAAIIIIQSAINYFFQPKISFFIHKKIVEYLDDNKRIKYQKAQAVTMAVFGIVIMITELLLLDYYIFSKIFQVSSLVINIPLAIIHKKYTGYYTTRNIPKK